MGLRQSDQQWAMALEGRFGPRPPSDPDGGAEASHSCRVRQGRLAIRDINSGPKVGEGKMGACETPNPDHPIRGKRPPFHKAANGLVDRPHLKPCRNRTHTSTKSRPDDVGKHGAPTTDTTPCEDRSPCQAGAVNNRAAEMCTCDTSFRTTAHHTFSAICLLGWRPKRCKQTTLGLPGTKICPQRVPTKEAEVLGDEGLQRS